MVQLFQFTSDSIVSKSFFQYESSEDYLERILMLEIANGKVKSIDIALDMNFSKPSVSIAMK